MGAGEILPTSMDRDGTNIGYDLPLTRAICEAISIPVTASGGASTPSTSWRPSPWPEPTQPWRQGCFIEASALWYRSRSSCDPRARSQDLSQPEGSRLHFFGIEELIGSFDLGMVVDFPNYHHLLMRSPRDDLKGKGSHRRA
jgi:hypothetical protein